MTPRCAAPPCAALAATIVLVLAPLPAARAQAPPPACTAPEHRLFDFWLGEWEVFTPDSNRVGANTIEPIAGSCGLLEHWRGARGGTGRSLNWWSPADRKWHQTWVGSGGSFLELEGGLEGAAMVMRGTTRDTSGTVQLERVSWTPLPDGAVRQFWEQSRDDGRTWSVAFLGIYRRKP